MCLTFLAFQIVSRVYTVCQETSAHKAQHGKGQNIAVRTYFSPSHMHAISDFFEVMNCSYRVASRICVITSGSSCSAHAG